MVVVQYYSTSSSGSIDLYCVCGFPGNRGFAFDARNRMVPHFDVIIGTISMYRIDLNVDIIIRLVWAN